MATRAKSIPPNALYLKPFSSLMLVMLSIVVTVNSILLALAFTAFGLVVGGDLETYYNGISDAATSFVNLLFWITVPAVIFITSCVDLHKFRKQTLSPGRLVFTAAACLALWVMIFVLWMPCSFTWKWEYASSTWDYCPYSPSAFVSAISLVPFFGFIPIFCYSLYLTLCVVTYRHSRTEPSASLEAGEQLDDLDLHKRYKLASGVYTDIDDGASDSLPSTFRGPDIISPAPTAHPPSYVTRDPGGPPSRRASSFLSEMSHWRRDVEMMSISGTSHLCSCACHHGVVPQEQITEEQHAHGHPPVVP